jgi:hypothetical protein
MAKTDETRYTFDTYRQAPRDHDAGETGTFQILLIRVDGQPSVNFLRSIPAPAQMDEWKLCETHIKRTQMEARTQTFFKQLIGRMARSPDVSSPKLSSPKSARDADETKISFPGFQI